MKVCGPHHPLQAALGWKALCRQLYAHAQWTQGELRERIVTEMRDAAMAAATAEYLFLTEGQQ